MTASWCRRVAGPGVRRDSISPMAQGCRVMTVRIEIARCRMATFQSRSWAGSSISLNTASIMPSRRSSLLETWLYSDIVPPPSCLAELAHAE